jgi:hypothetical protein
MAAARRFSLAEQLREQMQVETTPGQNVFCEEPVPLEVFLSDKKFMGQPPLSMHQMNLVRHMEQIYLPEMYPFMVENFGEVWTPVRFVNFLNVQWGKGSGKDHSVRMAVARIAYLLLCLESPQAYFEFAPQDEIHILNVAMNAAQARRAFFKPLGTLLKNTPWFKGRILSEITDMATSIRLEKQIELISGHSAVENFEGLNPIVAVLDEISGFQSNDQKAARGIVESQRTAEAVYDIVRTSASTRFPESFKVVAISYPRYLHDPIQELCADGLADIEKRGLEDSRYFVDGPRTTWEVNPRYERFEMIQVDGTTNLIPNVAAFVSDYENDPMMARGKYECKPERSSNRYFRNDSAIAQSFPKQPEGWVDPIMIDYYWGIDREGAEAEGSYELGVVPGWQANFSISPELVPFEGAIYALHADLAINGDRAGISMCHVKNWERREHKMGDPTNMKTDYQLDDRPVIKVDFVTSFESDLTATTPEGEPRAREIQIRWFRNLIRELKRRGFTVAYVTFDNFQSADSIQILEMWGIESDVQSVDRNIMPYSTLRDVMYDGRLEGYFRENLIFEIEGLTRLPNGKVDHPPGGGKDEADALCGAVFGALKMGGDEGEKPEEVDTNGPSLGYEIYGQMGGRDDFWGNQDWGISKDEYKFVTGAL